MGREPASASGDEWRVSCAGSRHPPASRSLAFSHANERTSDVPLAIAGTGYGIIGILVIILLVVLIFYFARRA
jgi:hypothetical protein